MHGTAAKILLGNTAYIGDPKPDPILAGELVNSIKTVETGKEGASRPSLDSINVEALNPITSECAAGESTKNTPCDAEG